MLYYLKNLLLLTLLGFTSLFSFAQNYNVSGKVINAKTGEALAFVNIIANQTTKGTSTDIDGKFTLQHTEPIVSIKLSYVGFETRTIAITDKKNNLVIPLQEKLLQLSEIKIIAGENPAHRIIRNVLRNRDINNPEKLNSFSYTSYNKLIFTSKNDSIAIKKMSVKDSTAIKMKSFLDKQHLLVVESVTKRKFLKPDKNYEEVMASRVSGFKNPIFTFIGSQLQSFSFYDESFNIFEKYYISPISYGSLSRYYFQIEDTLYSENKQDTTFVISYRPKTNTNFEGLKGLLYINTFHWAIENVTAQPAFEQKEGISINIQQKYELIDGKQWFPVQLNTDLSFMLENLPYPFIANARAYLKDITISPEIPKKTFNHIELDFKDSANMQPEVYWNLHRVDSLTQKELTTYHVVDSMGDVYHFESRLNLIQSIMKNKIPWGIIDFDIDKLIYFNEYEKIRLGLGLHTSDKFSKKFSVGGYWGYGFGDKTDKYGADVSIFIYKPWDLKLNVAYLNDLKESGGLFFYKDKKRFFDGNYREIFASNFDNTERASVSVSFRTFRYMQASIALNKTFKTSAFNYEYAVFQENATLFVNQFNYTDIQLGLRYAYKEKFMKANDNLIALPNTYPIIWFNYTKGIKGILEGEYDYQKIDVKIEKSIFTNYLGKTTFIAGAGYIDKNVPYNIMYAARAGYNNAYIDIPFTFNTMRYNEFVSNRYVSLMFKHSFGSLLFRFRRFNPEIVVLTNVLLGSMNNAASHRNILLKSPEKGYFESGICFNNLLKLGFNSLGLGIYHRYGPYSLKPNKENWALKWTLTIPI